MSIQFKVCSMNINLHRIPHVIITSELSQIDPQVKISEVFHSDGLLLCVTSEDNTRLVVWNPCTGQTKWIQPLYRSNICDTYTLGSYQGNKSNYNSYKILRYSQYGRFGKKKKNSKSMRLTPIHGGVLISLWTAASLLVGACL